jgi:hypothetical protein
MNCPLCGAETSLTTKNVYAMHQRPQTPRETCQASGMTRDKAQAFVRRFISWDEHDSVLIRMKVIDGGDSIIVDNSIYLNGDVSPERVANVAVRIRPKDTRRLIAELTAIADDRGL